MANPTTPRGLATLAMLKARFDAGQDHIGLLEPFVEDVLPVLGTNGFGVADCKVVLEQEHGLVVPQDVLATVLQRVVRSGKLRRDAGRYWLALDHQRSLSLRSECEAAEREFVMLAGEFRRYAHEKDTAIATDSDALVLLVAFLVDNDVVLVLDELTSSTALRSTALTNRQTRLVASFIRDLVLKDSRLGDTFQRLLRGIVLQDALLLRSIAHPDQSFADTTVYFDTSFLFSVVGAKGDAARMAARESLNLLRATGAAFAAFHRTLDEMKRILQVYERHLATAEGRLSLRASDLTHHFLAARSTPSDLRQMSSMLDTTIAGSGIVLRDMPTRDARFVLGEADLQRDLAQPHQIGDEPRILHDVNCVAAILQFRHGQNPTSLERCSAIFATSSGSVVRSVNSWFRAQGGTGVSPIIHHLALSNIAWLKKPAAAGSLQIHELAALCDAALRPSREVWDAFRAHLGRLRAAGEITTDEAVAIVASELTTAMLADVSDDIDTDADTFAEVVQRVRTRYRDEAEAALASHRAEADAEVARERARADSAEHSERRTTEHVTSRAHQLSRAAANTVAICLLIVAIAGVVLSLPGTFDRLSSQVKASAFGFAIIAGLIQSWGMLTGRGILFIRDRLHDWLHPAVAKVFLPPSE